MKNLIKSLGLCLIAFTLVSMAGVFDNFLLSNFPGIAEILIGSIPGVMTAGFIGVGANYWDSNGNYINENGTAARTVGGSVPLSGVVCQPKGNFLFPPQLTFVFTNPGAQATHKFTQADNMTEALVGSIGTIWPTIQQLPNNNTIAKQDGTNIFTAQSVAQMLQTTGLKVESMMLTGAAAGTNSVTLNVWRSSLAGPNQAQYILNLDTSNNTGNVVLRNNEGLDFTSNVSFNIVIPAASTYTLNFFNKGVITY